LHDFQGEYKYFKLEKIGKLIIFFFIPVTRSGSGSTTSRVDLTKSRVAIFDLDFLASCAAQVLYAHNPLKPVVVTKFMSKL